MPDHHYIPFTSTDSFLCDRKAFIKFKTLLLMSLFFFLFFVVFFF